MVDKNKEIKVTNRYSGTTVYIIPDMNNLRRQFAPGESRYVPFEELERLSWVPGGRTLLENNLVMEDAAAVKVILGTVEPEYYYDKNNVIEIMKNGTLDEFLDCLDFAPQGILEMIKTLAVEMPLNDVSKRNAIREKLGFDVDGAIRLRDEAKEEDVKAPTASKRRAAAPKETTEPANPARRTTPKYKVVKD